MAGAAAEPAPIVRVYMTHMGSLAKAAVDYWPAILVLVGLSNLGLLRAEAVFVRMVAILGLLLWTGLGVVYFFYHPSLIWLWRLLPIAFGLTGFASDYEEKIQDLGPLLFVFILMMCFCGGISFLFFRYEPAAVWGWVREQAVVQWLLAGPWYEVFMKVTGFLGAIAAALKGLAWLYAQSKD